MIDQGRTFQSRNSSRTSAKEAEAKASPSKQREKGLWNFLTWSFFISHIVAAQQAAAASAMAAEASVEDAARNTVQPADAHAAASSPEQGVFERAELPQGSAPQTQSIDPGALSFVAMADHADKQVHAEHSDEATAHGLPRGQMIVADLGDGSSPSDNGQLLQSPELGPLLDQVLDPIVDVVGGLVDNVVDPLLTPVTGLVGDVAGSLAPILEQVVSPVAGLAGSVIELVEPVLDPIIMPTAAILEEVLQSLDPVIDPVTGIAAGATALLGDAIEPVTAQIGDAIEPLVPVVNELTAPLGDVAGPLLAPLGSVLGPVTAPLLGPIADGIALLDPLTGGTTDSSNGAAPEPFSALLGLGSAGEPILIGPIAAAAGSLDLPALPVVGAIDELFAGTSYTDYNLALQGGAGAGVMPIAAGAPALDALVSGLENIALLQPDSGDAGSDASAAGLPSVLGGGLRGLDWVGL